MIVMDKRPLVKALVNVQTVRLANERLTAGASPQSFPVKVAEKIGNVTVAGQRAMRDYKSK